jgi:hypothetical protein
MKDLDDLEKDIDYNKYLRNQNNMNMKKYRS